MGSQYFTETVCRKKKKENNLKRRTENIEWGLKEIKLTRSV